MKSRRKFLLAGAAGLGAGLALPHLKGARPTLRLVHLTDIHLTPEAHTVDALTQVLRHVQNLSPRPDFIVQGGDAIMDALELPKDKVIEQWKTWHQVWKAECNLQVRQVLGNHDIFGWARPNPSPEGKRWALDELGLKRSYYSFDQGGWHFIVLDSIKQLPNFYEARLDDEQYDWLCQDLAAHSQPTCIISHIPLICFCAFFDGPNESSGHWKVPGAWMHLDARRLKDLFRRHEQVKICLSGHIHLQDHVRYLGIDYYCNGAVCGDYWRGPYQDFPPAYFIFDLFADGSHVFQMIDDFGANL